jgi:hypothetical protein
MVCNQNELVERPLKMRLKELIIEVASINKLPHAVPLSPAIAEAYRDQIGLGQAIAPLRVCFDGQNYWLFDGYHRLEVLNHICTVIVYRGSQEDAFRRYIKDKLRARGRAGVHVFKHCISEIQAHWSHLDNQTLARFFGRKPVFFDNIRHLFGPDKSFANRRFFSVNKHGTINLMQAGGTTCGSAPLQGVSRKSNQ